MANPVYAVGQVVFIRTDTADYEEETVPFQSLDELVQLSTQGRSHRVLERIIVFGMVNNEPHAITFSFLSATKGQRPNQPEAVDP
jgi:hypothetical protein